MSKKKEIIMKYCKKCDKSFSGDFLFCPQCGARLMSEEEVRRMNEETDARLRAQKAKEEENQQKEYYKSLLIKYLSRFPNGEFSMLVSNEEDGLPSEIFLKYASLDDLKEYYDVLIDHKNHKAYDMDSELYAEVRSSLETYKEIKNICNDEQVRTFTDFFSAWEDNGQCMVIDQKKFTSDRVSTYLKEFTSTYTYIFKKYRFNNSIISRISNNVYRGANDSFGYAYYRYKYEIKLINKFLSFVYDGVKRFKNEKNAYDFYISFLPPDSFISRLKYTQEKIIKSMQNERSNNVVSLGEEKKEIIKKTRNSMY